LLLRGNAAHGYNLLEALQQFGFAAGTLDASIVYRVLREMEDAGWVASAWQMPVSGPPRRVYQVTADGSDYLNWWITDLRRTRDEITGFLELYEARGETPSDGAAGAEHPTEPEESTQDTKGGRDL
jgi:DNA-binding PadR family transcriptional regulator